MARNRPLEGKTALVTGASAGIGRATADALGASGANVVVTARSEEKLETVAENISGTHDVESSALETDVRNPDSVAETIEATIAEFGELDILVCNAGVTAGDGSYDDVLEDVSLETYHKVTETNVNGTFYSTYAALPHLRETNGNLIFIGSSAGKIPRPGSPVYSASKWWLRGFALSVQAHAGQDGVAVSLINPTAVRTDIWRDTLDEGEAMEPEEIASVVVDACDQSPHTTLGEIDVFRRDLLGKFIPSTVDLEVSFDGKE